MKAHPVFCMLSSYACTWRVDTVVCRSVIKKLFNPVDHEARKLICGNFRISLAGPKAAFDKCGISTRMRFTDLLHNRNKMNVPPILRMISKVWFVVALQSRRRRSLVNVFLS